MSRQPVNNPHPINAFTVMAPNYAGREEEQLQCNCVWIERIAELNSRTRPTGKRQQVAQDDAFRFCRGWDWELIERGPTARILCGYSLPGAAPQAFTARAYSPLGCACCVCRTCCALCVLCLLRSVCCVLFSKLPYPSMPSRLQAEAKLRA